MMHAQVSKVMEFEPADVECYSGYKVNERPVAFIHAGRRRAVIEIIDRWYEGGCDPGRPAMDYFKVTTDTGENFILRYNALFNAWAAKVVATHGAR
jgi:hypothetical protein